MTNAKIPEIEFDVNPVEERAYEIQHSDFCALFAALSRNPERASVVFGYLDNEASTDTALRAELQGAALEAAQGEQNMIEFYTHAETSADLDAYHYATAA